MSSTGYETSEEFWESDFRPRILQSLAAARKRKIPSDRWIQMCRQLERITDTKLDPPEPELDDLDYEVGG